MGKKCKIINDRFYFNYCFQSVLLTASPLSIATGCQIIAPNPIALPFAIIFSIVYIAVIIGFLQHINQSQRPFISTRYWFVMLL